MKTHIKQKRNYNAKRWCVKTEHGWCRVKGGQKPLQVKRDFTALCGCEVTIKSEQRHSHVAYRTPTCKECKSGLFVGGKPVDPGFVAMSMEIEHVISYAFQENMEMPDLVKKLSSVRIVHEKECKTTNFSHRWGQCIRAAVASLGGKVIVADLILSECRRFASARKKQLHNG